MNPINIITNILLLIMHQYYYRNRNTVISILNSSYKWHSANYVGKYHFYILNSCTNGTCSPCHPTDALTLYIYLHHSYYTSGPVRLSTINYRLHWLQNSRAHAHF